MTDLNSTSTNVVVNAGQTLNILSPGGTAIGLENHGTVNGFRLFNSGGEVDGDFENFSIMQASGTNAFLLLSGGFDNINHSGATIRALATGSGNTTTVEMDDLDLFNSGTVAAIGSSGANATVDVDRSSIDQTSTGRVVASGNAVVDFSTSLISGGTLATVGSNASAGVFDPGTQGDVFFATIAPNTNIGAVGFLFMEGVQFGTNDTVKAYDGGTAFLSNVTPAANDKFIASGGSLAIQNDGSLVLKSGTLLEATSNGIVSATANGGALTNSVGATIEALANAIGTSAFFSIRGSAGVNNGGTVAAVASGAATFASGHVDGGGAAVNNSGSMVASGIANGIAVLQIETFGSDAAVNNKKTIEALATSNGSAFLDIIATTSPPGHTVVTNGGAMVASATFDGFADMEVGGTSVVNSGTFGAFANHQALALADVSTSMVANTKTMVASANDESEAQLQVELFEGKEHSFINSKGGTFGALATSNSFASAGVVGGQTLNNGGTIIALARANSEANTSVFFESGTNSGTIVAKAGGLDGGFSNAILRLDVNELNNSGGTIWASATGGGSAIVDIGSSFIEGGLLKTTVGTGNLPGRPQAWIGVFTNSGTPAWAEATVTSATIAANIGAFGSGAFLALIDDTIKTGATIEAASGGSVFIEEDFTISTGVTIQALNSGGIGFDTEVTISGFLGGGSLINNGSVKAVNLATASGGTDNRAAVLMVETSSVTNNATMLAANSGGAFNSASVSFETETFTNKGSFKALNSGGFHNSAFAGAFVFGSATNSGAIAAIDSGGTDNLTSVFVDAGASFTNAASGIVEAVVSGGTSGGSDNVAFATVEGGSSLTNNGSMVASANGGQGHLFQGGPTDAAFLVVETIFDGATLTNNKTILGAATSGGLTSVFVGPEGPIDNNNVINKGVISGSANSGSETFLQIIGSSVVNSKSIAAQATVFSDVEVFIGGNSISNAASASMFAGATSGSSAFLSIEFDSSFTNSGSVTVSTSASSIGDLFILGGPATNTVTNTKAIQVVANGQSHVEGKIIADTINNSGLMAASAGADSTASLEIFGFVNNKDGKIVASGAAEVIFGSGTTVSGGTLATTGSGVLLVSGNPFFNSGHAPTAVTVEGATLTSGSTFLVEGVSGFVPGGVTFASAVLTLSGGDTIGKGAIVEAESGGIVSVTGTVTNSGGTFLALTSGTIDFTSTSNVNGNGVAVVQNGIVEIDGGGNETVDFTATGTGGLELVSGNLYQGIVSGFGGPSHQNTTQFIDFRSVSFDGGATSAVYVPDGAHPTLSGSLELVDNGTVEATVELAGNYTNAVFSVTDDGSGGVKVTDPVATTNGGTTTVTGNSPTGGTVVNSANAALFGNYMASMFATLAFNGGALSSDLHAELQPQLAPPHH